jgi:hypothetical protein
MGRREPHGDSAEPPSSEEGPMGRIQRCAATEARGVPHLPTAAWLDATYAYA